jgi:pilus assembly protein CpaE
VVLLRSRLDDAFVSEALRAGVREVVRVDDGPGIAAACARSLGLSRQPVGGLPGPPPPPAPPVVVPGPVHGDRENGGSPAAPPHNPPSTPIPGFVPASNPGLVPAASRGLPPTGAALSGGNSESGSPAPGQPGTGRPAGGGTGGGEPAGGQVIAVFGGKGGAGKSMIATNLAVALADRRSRVCLIDLDLAFGDVGILLQLAPDRTLADAIGLAERLDHTGLRTLLTPYRTDLDVLLAPVAPAAAEQVGRGLVETVIALARSAFDYVIVDCASQFSEPVLAALDTAHFHVLVTTPELTALKGLRVTLDMFDLLDYRRDGRLLVLNRADTKVGLSTADAEKVLRSSITAQVPSSREVPVSVNRGVPLVQSKPRHPVSAAIRTLADRFAVDAQASRGGLRRLIGRGGGAAQRKVEEAP